MAYEAVISTYHQLPVHAWELFKSSEVPHHSLDNQLHHLRIPPRLQAASLSVGHSSGGPL